jgi:hypothetical protein
MHLYQLPHPHDDSIILRKANPEAIQPGREGMFKVKNCPLWR